MHKRNFTWVTEVEKRNAHDLWEQILQASARGLDHSTKVL